MSEENRRSDGYYSELRGLIDKLDRHMEEEGKTLQQLSEKMVGVEINLSAMTEYVKKVTEILERITTIEERDKTRSRVIDDITLLLRAVNKEMQTNKENAAKDLTAVDKKIDRLGYIATGVFAVCSIIWTVLGGSINSKMEEFSDTIDKMKVHLEINRSEQQPQFQQPLGWKK